MKTRSTSRASATPATPARPRVASAVPDRLTVLALLILSSCGGASAFDSSNIVRYTARKVLPPAETKSEPHFVVEVSHHGSKPHILVVWDRTWVTLNLGEAQDLGKEFEINPEADEPLPQDLGVFSGTILAVRCRDGQEGLIDVDLRAYRVENGRVAGRKGSKDSLAKDEVRELILPW